jgi:hypothetical protein
LEILRKIRDDIGAKRKELKDKKCAQLAEMLEGDAKIREEYSTLDKNQKNALLDDIGEEIERGCLPRRKS